MDNSLDTLMNVSKYPTIEVPHILKRILFRNPNNILSEESNRWIQNYIKNNFNKIENICCIFESLSDCPADQKVVFVKVFLDNNDSIEDFKKLPLIPSFLSWSGSAVPVYSSIKSFCEKILPQLRGIKFLYHKRYVLEKIDYLTKLIEDEQINNILNN